MIFDPDATLQLQKRLPCTILGDESNRCTLLGGIKGFNERQLWAGTAESLGVSCHSMECRPKTERYLLAFFEHSVK